MISFSDLLLYYPNTIDHFNLKLYGWNNPSFTLFDFIFAMLYTKRLS